MTTFYVVGNRNKTYELPGFGVGWMGMSHGPDGLPSGSAERQLGHLWVTLDPPAVYTANGAEWVKLGSGDTAQQVLDKLLTVDADDSGLNATTLRGKAPSDFVPSTRAVKGTSGQITGGGDLSEDRTLGLADVTGLTPGTYARATVEVDQKGRVTGVSEGAAGAVADASPAAKGVGFLDAGPFVAGEPRFVGANSPRFSALIEGLYPEWVSGTQVRVSSSVAYVPGIGTALEVSASLSPTMPALAASTMYYLYLHRDANGAAAVEVSTQTPASPYRGAARVKGGTTPDETRRYVGAFRTNAAAAVLRFRFHPDGYVKYTTDTGAAPLRVLNGSGATVSTVVSAAGPVPPSSRLAVVRLTAVGAGVTLFVPGEEATVDFHGAGTDMEMRLALDANRQFGFRNTATGGAAYVDVRGYLEER